MDPLSIPTFTFPIFPLARFEQPGQTSIKRPREFLYFSFDENRDIHLQSEKSLRYYYPPFIETPGVPVPPVSLSEGFESWIRSDESIDHHLDGLLEAIQAHEADLRAQRGSGEGEKDVRVKADVITWRGMMTKILTAPYDLFSDFEMNATSYQGAIYIEENHAYKQPSEQQQSNKRPPRRDEVPQEMMQYWGYKFENLSVLKNPWPETTRHEIDSRDLEPVNNNEQFCSIVRTAIGSTTLILAGEVDCILHPKAPSSSSSTDTANTYIELKTSAPAPEPSSHPKEKQKFERKLLKFWAQSFLLAVPKIIVGFRSPQGFLTGIQEFETQKLPGMVARGEGTWDGNVCLRFAAAFLEWLRETLGGSEGVWRIRRRRGGREVEVFCVEERGTGGILREEFLAHREALLRSKSLVEKDEKMTGTPLSTATS